MSSAVILAASVVPAFISVSLLLVFRFYLKLYVKKAVVSLLTVFLCSFTHTFICQQFNVVGKCLMLAELNSFFLKFRFVLH